MSIERSRIRREKYADCHRKSREARAYLEMLRYEEELIEMERLRQEALEEAKDKVIRERLAVEKEKNRPMKEAAEKERRSCIMNKL